VIPFLGGSRVSGRPREPPATWEPTRPDSLAQNLHTHFRRRFLRQTQVFFFNPPLSSTPSLSQWSSPVPAIYWSCRLPCRRSPRMKRLRSHFAACFLFPIPFSFLWNHAISRFCLYPEACSPDRLDVPFDTAPLRNFFNHEPTPQLPNATGVVTPRSPPSPDQPRLRCFVVHVLSGFFGLEEAPCEFLPSLPAAV